LTVRGFHQKRRVHGLHFHDLRHTFCTNLILAGADLKNVKEMIGHPDLAMTDRYTHMTGQRKQFWQDKLAEQYGNGGRSTANEG
jgi:site-specific recombinase XerD